MRDPGSPSYGGGMRFAEDFLLLMSDPGGSTLVTGSTLHVGVAGAALCELAELGRVGLDDRDALLVLDRDPLGDPLNDRVLAGFAELQGKKPKAVLARVGKDLLPAIRVRLQAQGRIGHEEKKILWVFPHPTWPLLDQAGQQALRSRLGQVLAGAAPVDADAGSLIALVQGVDRTKKVFGGGSTPAGATLSDRELVKRAKELARGSWAGTAVAKAVSEAAAAAAAAATVAISAGSSSN